MDERLAAGRHHLANGERALRDGFPDESRSCFHAALLQFRGPDLRLGEAHALRGLAQVELACGALASSEDAIHKAIEVYRDVRDMLDRLDEEGVAVELGADAEEGEGAALVLLGELLLRAGRTEEARQVMQSAREVFDGLGPRLAAAGALVAQGRLDLREGRLLEAGEAFDSAARMHRAVGDLSGQSAAMLLRGEVDRVAGDLGGAGIAMEGALDVARQARDQALIGRALSARASLLAQQGDDARAEAAFDEAMTPIRESGDAQAEAYALLGRGDARSRRLDPFALHDLAGGAELLAKLEHKHGLGLAMLRASGHLLRVGLPGWALAAAESARQLWLDVDPTRGVAQALRLEVKALAALKQWPAVAAVTEARVAVAGAEQPNAVEVRDHYRKKLPPELFSSLQGLSRTALESKAEAAVLDLLRPMLVKLDLDGTSLGIPAGALAVLEAVRNSTPVPAHTRDVVPVLPDSALEPLPEPPMSRVPESLERSDDVLAAYSGLYDPPPAEPTTRGGGQPAGYEDAYTPPPPPPPDET